PDKIEGKDLQGWLKELKENKDPSIRDSVVKTLPAFGPDARSPSLKPLLAAMSREQDPSVRVTMINTLGIIGATTPDESREITEVLSLALVRTAPGSVVRLYLIKAMTNYGPAAYHAMSNLLAVRTDPAWETRRALAYAFGRIGYPTDPDKGPSPGAMDAAVSMLKDDCMPVRLEAVQSLVLLGAPYHNPNIPNDYPTKVKPYLDAAMNAQKAERDRGIQIWLQMLVMRYDGGQLTDPNIKLIANHLDGIDVGAQLHALTALGMLGDRAKPFVPKIASVLNREEPPVVYGGVSTLATIGESAKAALPDLEKLKGTTKDENLKGLITQTISTIRGENKPMPKKN
ncbi:MAG: HEAT repeat domain-containing protein, partial [Gemmataceae bacterium]